MATSAASSLRQAIGIKVSCSFFSINVSLPRAHRHLMRRRRWFRTDSRTFIAWFGRACVGCDRRC